MSQRSLIERIPRYLLHKPTNRGYARFDGHFVYFGTHNSAASLEAYNRCVAEWIQNGGRLAPASRNERLSRLWFVILIAFFVPVF